MPFAVRVDKEFAGPTLQDLEPILDDLSDPVEVRWTGSRVDFLTLERHSARSLILVTPDDVQRERTIWILGGTLDMSPDDLEAAKLALTNKRDQTWRLRVSDMGTTRGTLLLTKVVGDAIRNGKRPPASVSVALDCLHRQVNPADADVLLRLRTANPRLLRCP